MTEQEVKEVQEKLAAQDTVVNNSVTVKPVELRDQQDMVELIVNSVTKKLEAINSNRDIKKLAPMASDSKEVKDMKFKQLVRSILINDRAAYGEAADHFGGSVRAFSTTDASGGYSIPPDVRTEIIKQVIDSGVVRRNANVFQTNSDAVQLNALLTAPTVAWGTEATAVAATDGTQTAPSITIGKIIAILGPFSNEILADAAPGFYQTWVNIIGSQIGQLEDYTAFLGDGTATYNSITGMFIGTTASQGSTDVTLTTTDVQASVDLANKLQDVIAAVPAGMRTGAKFYFHRSLEAKLFQTRSTSGELLLGTPNQSTLGNLLGYPYELVDVLTDVSSVATGTAFLAFGNLSKHLHVADRQQMTMFVSDQGYVGSTSLMASDQMAVRVTERLGMVVHVPRFAKFGGSSNVDRKGLVLLKTA